MPLVHCHFEMQVPNLLTSSTEEYE